MVDPFVEVVALLQPGAPFSKRVFAAGSWSVRREEFGRPFYCVVLEGSCTLSVDDREPVALEAGDFVLIPSAYNFTMSGGEPTTAQPIEPSVIDGQVRLGVCAAESRRRGKWQFLGSQTPCQTQKNRSYAVLRLPNASATARRARSASHSPAMSGCRRRGMPVSR